MKSDLLEICTCDGLLMVLTKCATFPASILGQL